MLHKFKSSDKPEKRSVKLIQLDLTNKVYQRASNKIERLAMKSQRKRQEVVVAFICLSLALKPSSSSSSHGGNSYTCTLCFFTSVNTWHHGTQLSYTTAHSSVTSRHTARLNDTTAHSSVTLRHTAQRHHGTQQDSMTPRHTAQLHHGTQQDSMTPRHTAQWVTLSSAKTKVKKP